MPFPRAALALGVTGLCISAAVFYGRAHSRQTEADALAEAMLAVRNEMCSGRNLKGTGARLDVFATADSTSPSLQSGIVPLLDLAVTPSAPVAAGQTVRWSGWIKARSTGPYRFQLPKGVAGELRLSRLVVAVGNGSSVDSASTIDLEADRLYPFALTVTADARARDAGAWLLSWVPPGESLQPVMRGSLFPPTESAARPAAVAPPAARKA